jgi:uncharacterized protein YecT (DUF1311 family)
MANVGPLKYSLVIAAVGLMAWPHVRAEDISKSKCDVAGAAALAQCLNTTLVVEDKRLNAVYGLIMKMLDAGAVDPAAFFYNKQKSLVAAERAWVRFRDAQCAAEVDMLNQASSSGEVQVSGDCMLKMTRERIAYLKGVAASLTSDSKLCEKDADACQMK